MKRILPVVTALVVVLSLCVIHPLAASTATVDYSLTRVSPILGEAVVTDTPMEDVYTLDWYGFYKPYMSFEIDKFINYFPPSFGSGYTMSLYFDDADFEGATGFKFYIVNLTASETAHYVRVDVADAVVSVVENMFDDFGVYFNEVTVYGENLDISDINIIIDCYVGELNSEENYRGVSFPVSKLSVTYDATTSQGIFLDSINENTTAIYNSLTTMTPEMESKLEEFDSIVTNTGDKAGQAEDELSNQDPDFKDDNVSIADQLQDTADQMGEIVEQSGYSQWLNDVFGHWFFVAVFSVLGGLAFFGRAVFG